MSQENLHFSFIKGHTEHLLLPFQELEPIILKKNPSKKFSLFFYRGQRFCIEPKKKKERREKKEDGIDHPDHEIAEANRLRASLGLKPLK